MEKKSLDAGVDAFATIAQGLMHASVRHRMKAVYRRDIKPKLVGKIPPGQGALLCLVTFEPKALDLGLVPRQVVFHHLGLVGIGVNSNAMKERFERTPAIWSAPPNRMMRRVMRYYWLREYQIHTW